MVASEDSRAFDDPGIFAEIPLVNQIRPRVVVRDDAVPNARTYTSRLYHIYNDSDVKDDLNRRAKAEEPLPDLVLNACDHGLRLAQGVQSLDRGGAAHRSGDDHRLQRHRNSGT